MTYLLRFLLSRLKQLITKKSLTIVNHVVPFITENYRSVIAVTSIKEMPR